MDSGGAAQALSLGRAALETHSAAMFCSAHTASPSHGTLHTPHRQLSPMQSLSSLQLCRKVVRKWDSLPTVGSLVSHPWGNASAAPSSVLTRVQSRSSIFFIAWRLVVLFLGVHFQNALPQVHDHLLVVGWQRALGVVGFHTLAQCADAFAQA